MMQLQEKFRTPRLLLTRVGRADLDDMLGMHREPQLAEALGREQGDRAIAARVEKLAAHWDQHGFGWWVIREPATGRLIGRGGLRQTEVDGASGVELGYVLRPEFWNQGLATELSRVSVAQGFVQLGLSEIVGFALPANHGSRRVMEKTGMRYERDVTRAGARHALYRLTAAHWRTGPSASANRSHSAQELVAG